MRLLCACCASIILGSVREFTLYASSVLAHVHLSVYAQALHTPAYGLRRCQLTRNTAAVRHNVY
jgi:hypothetical protein